MDFAEFERRLVKRMDDADLTFELARIIYELDPVWHLVILQLDPDLIAAILRVLITALPHWSRDYRPIVWVLAVLTLAVGSVMAVVQTLSLIHI